MRIVLNILILLIVAITVLIIGYPMAYTAVHGLDQRAWPSLLGTPWDWFNSLLGMLDNLGSLVTLVGDTYYEMLRGRSPNLAGRGPWAVVLPCIAGLALWSVLYRTRRFVPARHFSRRFGDAHFASPADLGRMRTGLELGVDPDTGRAVRVRVEGNLVTIAPPRSGKTSGLILPNLLFPDSTAWAGPVVVIDPKGEVVRAVRRRRQALGQTVRVLDPLGIAGVDNTDRWNPLEGLRPQDVIELQAVGKALIPASDSSNDNGAFFRERAAVLIASALQVVLRRQGSLADVATLVRNGNALTEALQGSPGELAKDALNILTVLAEKTRGDVLNTAAGAFSWLLDDRLQDAVTDPTFALTDLREGDTDLFVVLPADEDRRKVIAPYARWLLSNIFSTFRQKRPRERLVILVDEAFVLGRFESLVSGAGELPGYGVSLWSFWTSEHQIVENFGEAGKGIMMDTAEAVLLFSLSGAQGAERERWSTTLGTFTGIQETTSVDPVSGRESVSRTAVAEALVPASELARLTQHHTLVSLTSRAYTTDPLKLKKVFAHEDPRFTGLFDAVPPTGPLA